jgi:tetratricopeptide (TPR) repeat protein
LEKWYAKKCKVLYELAKFQECIDTGLEALKIIPNFHYRNDKWIKREIARSFGGLGNPGEGIKWLEQIMDIRAEWFLVFDRAILHFQNGETEKALKYAVQAALAQQGLNLKMKLNLYSFIGEVLHKLGEEEHSRKHLLLSAKIRAENDWKVPVELQELMDIVNVDMSDNTLSSVLEKELSKYWQTLTYFGMKHSCGIIKNLVASGKSGFISGDDKQEYYFRVNDFHGKPELIQPGLCVTFYVQASDQANKLDNAINVTIQKK